MNPFERGILDTVARAKREGLEPKSIYLSADYIEGLRLAGEVERIGGLPVKRSARRSMLYCRHGLARTISPATVDSKPFTPAEQQLLVSLLNDWPTCASPPIFSRLRRRGLLATRERVRRHKGRSHHIGEPRLTGLGEEEAQRLWDRMSRDERAELRAAAMRSGL